MNKIDPLKMVQNKKVTNNLKKKLKKKLKRKLKKEEKKIRMMKLKKYKRKVK